MSLSIAVLISIAHVLYIFKDLPKGSEMSDSFELVVSITFKFLLVMYSFKVKILDFKAGKLQLIVFL